MASWIKGVHHAAPFHDVNRTEGIKVNISVLSDSQDFQTLMGLGYKRDYWLDRISHHRRYCAFIIPAVDYQEIKDCGLLIDTPRIHA